MSQDQQSSSLFTQVDITAGPQSSSEPPQDETTRLLQEILSGQDRQNELLEELISTLTATQRQRSNELAQWRKANPDLASGCRTALETLSQIQSEYLRRLVGEVEENSEGLSEGEFLMNEFVDRFGPRLAHLHGVLQVLSQLGGPAGAEEPS